jgi:hypothetical protein
MKSQKILSLFVISTMLALLTVSAFAGQARAAVSWQVTLTASCQGYSSQTILGVASDATNGYDPAYDILVSPPPGPGVSAVYSHLDDAYSKSIKPEAPSMTWVLKVTPFVISGDMQLSWTSIPPQYSGYIKDSTGTTTLADMSAVSQYTYSANADILVVFQVNLVIPEYPLGILLVLTGCFAAYGIRKLPKRL